ncbi:MAG: aspartate-semialdehyde dehydrogenase [Acidobacteria bacterium]|nr:aspartate-semialdehyde dehydrogenase [Acidobacteriota bacterium]
MSEIRPHIEVGVLGGTGMVGQHFIRFLENHPWFRLGWIGASERSAGRAYAEATNWRLDGVMPAAVRGIRVSEARPGKGAPRVLFSAMDAAAATEIEQAFAAAGHVVVSNSRNHRMEPDVPLLVPEVNPDHLTMIPHQQRRRGWEGMIVTNPNCSTVVLALALAPLRRFGISRVLASTMQAVSGAGYPGVASMDIQGNVVPFISGEEEKMQQETQKILGDFAASPPAIHPLAAKVSASCHRVPVVDGHTVAISVELRDCPAMGEIAGAMAGFQSHPQQRKLPSAPPHPIIVMDEADRPQPRRDSGRENGMAVFVGRIRTCPVLSCKFVALGHNTIRGAAGAAVLNAELMMTEGLLS